MTFLAYIQGMFEPIRDIVEKFNIFQDAMASGERVFGLMKEPSERGYEKTKTSFPELREFRGNIEFQNIWFAYNDSDYVLKGLSFKIEAGQSFDIVGVTGSGKTSVVSVLTRLYEIDRGKILIDKLNIQDIENNV